MEDYVTTIDLLPSSDKGYEDLSEIIRETNNCGDHSKLLKVIQEKKLSLMSHIKHGESDESRMLLKKLLDDVVNGHKIVKAILDNCVGETCEEEDSIDFAIKIRDGTKNPAQFYPPGLIRFYPAEKTQKNPG